MPTCYKSTLYFSISQLPYCQIEVSIQKMNIKSYFIVRIICRQYFSSFYLFLDVQQCLLNICLLHGILFSSFYDNEWKNK